MAESTSNFSYRIALKWVLNFRWTTITCPLDWVTNNHWAWWWPAGYALLSQNKHSSSNAIGMYNATSHCQQFLREVSHWFCLKSIQKRCNYSFLRRYNRLVLQCVSSLVSPSAFLVNTKSGKNEKKILRNCPLACCFKSMQKSKNDRNKSFIFFPWKSQSDFFAQKFVFSVSSITKKEQTFLYWNLRIRHVFSL